VKSKEKPIAERTVALRRRIDRLARPALRPAAVAVVAHGLAGLLAARLLADVVTAIVFAHAAVETVAGPLLALAGIAVVRAGLTWTADLGGRRAASLVRDRLFADLLDRFSALGPVRLARWPTGELVGTATDAVAAIEADVRGGLPGRIRVRVIPLAVLVATAVADRWAALILLVVLPLLPLAMILTGKGAEEASDRQWASLARLGGHLLDSIRGLADLRLAGASAAAVAEVRIRAEDFGRRTMAVLRIAFLSSLALEFFATAAIAGVAVSVGFRLMWGTIDFATGFFVLLLVPEFFAPIRALGSARHARMEADAALDTIAAVLDGPVAAGGDRQRPSGSAPRITFEGVGLVHVDGRRVLEHLDLEVDAGERVALVGPSGAGKSTLFALLCGFLAPTEGRILIDGVDLAELDLASWRRAIVHLPQTPHLFAVSLAENVALGRPHDRDLGCTLDAAIAAAGASDFVAALPDGRATRLGDGGCGLSGGEIQRIALARAFFAPGDLVLFDEPTAHLDRDTEAVVGPALRRLAEGRTMLTIAHRLETLGDVDRIVVLDAGRVVGEFRPADLDGPGDRRRRIAEAVLGHAAVARGEGRGAR
jgi:ATP-binding cassette subfamily C protein CydD